MFFQIFQVVFCFHVFLAKRKKNTSSHGVIEKSMIFYLSYLVLFHEIDLYSRIQSLFGLILCRLAGTFKYLVISFLVFELEPGALEMFWGILKLWPPCMLMTNCIQLGLFLKFTVHANCCSILKAQNVEPLILKYLSGHHRDYLRDQ